MPNKDKTGPEGKGPKTGRGLGNCEGANQDSERPRQLGTNRRPRCGRRRRCD